MSDLIVRGRYQIVPDGGDKPKPHTRVTNFAKKLDDTYTLTSWKMRNVLKGAAQRTDIIAATLAAVDDKSELDRLAESALDAAKANVGRETGTALHTLTEYVDAGQAVDAPPAIKGDLDAYQECMATLGVTIKRMEEVVVIPELNLAGRFDRLVDIMGETYVMDLKTGADLSYSWLSIAIQLAVYAQATTIYDPATHTHEPMPHVNQSKALVVPLPAGQAKATPYWVDLNVGRHGIDLTKAVLGWRATKGAATVATNVRTDLREYVKAHVAYIVAAGHGADLAKRWPDDVPTLKSSDGHTEAQYDEILEACWTVEGIHEMAFIEMSDPRVVDQPMKASKGAK